MKRLDLKIAERYQAYAVKRLDRFIAEQGEPMPGWWATWRRRAAAARVAIDLLLAARSVEMSIADSLRIVDGELRRRRGDTP